MSYKLIGKHFSVFFFAGSVSLLFREMTYAKNVKFTIGFLCCSFVEEETKEAFCSSFNAQKGHHINKRGRLRYIITRENKGTERDAPGPGLRICHFY